MGGEVACALTWNGQRSEGKALLEADHVLFRGDFRVKLALREVRAVESRGGRLFLRTKTGEGVFELGPKAATWAAKIRNPKPLLDKLGVEPESRVSVIGVDDDAFLRALAARAPDVSRRARKRSDLVFLRVDALPDLARLARLRAAIEPDGAVWVLHPKRRKDVRDVDVIAAAREAGLVDVKVASFSATLSALKLVVPIADRRKR